VKKGTKEKRAEISYNKYEEEEEEEVEAYVDHFAYIDYSNEEL
jgi:hypothetical protein